MYPLYLFAPENDMALAFGGPHYTPTPAAQTIARDLSLLPLWYALEPNAYVWSSQLVDDTLQQHLDAMGITSKATSRPTAPSICKPWGWSAYITDKFTRAGIDRHLLPDSERIEHIRNLSGRATTRTILQALHNSLPQHTRPPLPKILHNIREVEEYVTSQPASMLKSPWSSSGRGVWAVRGTFDNATARSAQGIIRKQGYIMGEKLCDKIIDFAMEFYSDGQSVQFAGYSLFNTDERGAYLGNLLAHNNYIEQQLLYHIDIELLQNTRAALIDITTQIIAPHYIGYFGIDMLIYQDRDKKLLHPCIELNLRMNMGMVARIIADRFIAENTRGYYYVYYANTTTQLQQRHEQLKQEHPLLIENQKIIKGYLPLTPIQHDTHYCAYIVI